MRIDAHQHVWTEPLVAALARRTSAPRVLRSDASWWLEVSGEAPSDLPAAPDDAKGRSALVHEDGVERALVAPSTALRIDSLPPDEALLLAGAYDEGVRGLPDAFGSWAVELDGLRTPGHVGLCRPYAEPPPSTEREATVNAARHADRRSQGGRMTHDRPLDVHELRDLATDLAASTSLWQDCVRHDPAQRTFHQLLETDHAIAWLICWMPGHDTGFHDHDGCRGAVAVVEGAVREERIRWAHTPAARTVAAGGVFDFGVADIHRVLHTGTRPAVTIHAYSPVPRLMGAYVPGPGGVLQRHVVPEGEELRADAFAVA